MSWAAWVGVAFLGGLGALARFGLTLLIADRLHPHFPLGTLAVNLSGAFLLGFLAGTSLGSDGRLVLGAGAIGAYTTFSTWMLETQRVGTMGRQRLAAANLLLSIVLGLGAAALGRLLGMQI
ncbi:MAG TPA: fluoride efflux transporter CrcB [Solirubrobacterales bacterium]